MRKYKCYRLDYSVWVAASCTDPVYADHSEYYRNYKTATAIKLLLEWSNNHFNVKLTVDKQPADVIVFNER